MECTHDMYNPDCSHCRDVYQYCGYAEKEGYADFIDYFIVSKKSGDFELTAAGWEAMKVYYDKSSEMEEPDDLGDEENPEESEVSDSFQLYA